MCPFLNVRNTSTFEAPMCPFVILFFCLSSLHRGNHCVEFHVHHSHPLLYSFTTCGCVLTFVSVFLSLKTQVLLPFTCWVLNQIGLMRLHLQLVVLMTEICYRHIVRIHSQISKRKVHIRQSMVESMSGSPEGPHRVHSLHPAVKCYKTCTVFLPWEAF